MKTRDEVEVLKANWTLDPCWDIYETEGFEDYREHLKEYQTDMEKGWKRKTKYIQVMENNNLRHLKLNETLQLKNGWLVLAVPGGWIYSWMTIEIKIHGPSSTFPEIAIFVPKPLQVGLKK